MQIGQILVEQRWVAAAALARALAEQRLTGKRICSLLIARGLLDPDDAARALATQHGVPGALQRHLDHRDRALAQRLPASIARSCFALPIGHTSDQALIVCVRDPRPELYGILATALGGPVVLAVAPATQLEGLIRQAYDTAPGGATAGPSTMLPGPPTMAPGPATVAASEDDDDDLSIDIDMSTRQIPVLRNEAVLAFARGDVDVDLTTRPIDLIGGELGDLGSMTLVELDDDRVARDPTQSGPGLAPRTPTSPLPASRTTSSPLGQAPAPRTTTSPLRSAATTRPSTASLRGTSSPLGPPARPSDASLRGTSSPLGPPARPSDAGLRGTSSPLGAATRPVPAPSVEPPPVEPPLAIEPPPPIEPPLRPVEVATRPVVPPLGPIEPPKRATAAPPGPATQPAAPRSIAPPLGGAAPGLRPIPPLRRSIPKIGDAAGAGSASPLDAAIAAIAEAANADAANDAAMQYVAGQFRHAVLFAIKDGLAFGDRGHGGQLTAEVIQSITIPLSTPSIVQAAHDTRRLATLASGAAASQDSLARTLGIVAALPVEVGDRVGYVVALGERTAAAGGRSGDLEPLAAALTAAHQRLLQR